VNQAMKRYALSKEKNISRLLEYAELLRVKSKIVLTWSSAVITKNSMQLKAFIKKKAAEKHITEQLVLQNYMLERLLERITLTKISKKLYSERRLFDWCNCWPGCKNNNGFGRHN
jgi:hypothetical protein